MDVEDETNSYLKYLNDPETQNTYLGNNEVGLFSVEPIFTEIETSDWQPDGFPMLLCNSPVAEESPRESLSASEGISDAKNSQNNLNNFNTKGDDISEFQSNVSLNRNIPEENTGSTKNNVNEYFSKEYKDFQEKEALNKNTTWDTTPESKVIHVLNTDGSLISVQNFVLNHIKLPATKKKNVIDENCTKSINDLFSTVIANRCNVCSFLCENLVQIKKHIGDNHPEYLNIVERHANNGVSVLKNQNSPIEVSEIKEEYTVYICSICKDVCTSREDLREHITKIHNLNKEAQYALTQIKETEKCKSESKYLLNLSEEIVDVIKEQEKSLQKIGCRIKGCKARFPTDETRQLHESLHVDGKRTHIQCVKCEKTFIIWRMAKNHMLTSHGIDFGVMVCPMCNKYKNYKAVNMLKHMDRHGDKKRFKCTQCDKSFKEASQLRNHAPIHYNPNEIPSWSKIEKCTKCDRLFSNIKSLKNHMQTVHENFKPFICKICGHKSARKAMMELHERQHTGFKPFSCKLCSYQTGDHNCLRRHLMKHVGATQYQCPYCPYNCIQSGSLKYHLKNKHESSDDLYFCKYCPYNSINQDILAIHEKKHNLSPTGTDDENINKLVSHTNKDDDIQLDEETQNSSFLNTDLQPEEETEDRGGITIPAGLEMQLDTS